MNRDQVIALQNSGKLFYITATGGGTSFVGNFLNTVSGGSKCIIGGFIPYASELTDDFIGHKLDKYADNYAARKLAVSSFDKLESLKFPIDKIVGVGVACSLKKENEREGRKNVANIAIHTNEFTFSLQLVFDNLFFKSDSEKWSRENQELTTNNVVLCLLDLLFSKKTLLGDINKEAIICSELGTYYSINYNYSLFKDKDIHVINSDNIEIIRDRIILYPGSFNPLHDAHSEIKSMAELIFGQPVYFELSQKNSYKSSMDFIELNERSSQFKNPLILTKAPRFVDKVTLIKNNYNVNNIIIVVGADIWHRVYDQKAHENGDIKFFKDNNVKFLVFGRNTEIKYQDSELFYEDRIAMQYNNKISSTELRNKNK